MSREQPEERTVMNTLSERDQRIRQLLAAGNSLDRISGRMRVCRTTVKKVNRLWKMELAAAEGRVWRAPRPPRPERNEQIIGLYRDGIPFSAIAKRFKISRSAVAGVIDRARKNGADVPKKLSGVDCGRRAWARSPVSRVAAKTPNLADLIAQADALIAG